MHRPRVSLFVGLALLAGVLAVLNCPAEDKPIGKPTVLTMFGGSPARNLANAIDKKILDDFIVKKGKEKNVKWSVRLGSKAYGGPVIANGMIYVGTNNEQPRNKDDRADKGVMMCFQQSDGKFLWQNLHDTPEEESHYSPKEGLASAPAIEDDAMYYATPKGAIVRANAKTGKIEWRYDMVKELDIFIGQLVYTSPLIIGDLVYAMTSNGVEAGTGKLPKPKAPAMVAINKTTGKLAWSSNLPGAKVMRGQWTSPTGAKVNDKWQVIYGGGDGWLYGLDAKTGDLIWKFDCNPKKATAYKVGGGGEKGFIIATPVVHKDKLYIGIGQEPDDGPGVGHLWCIDLTKKPTNKDKDLSPVGDNFDPKAAVNKDSGLVWHLGGKLPKARDDGKEFEFHRTFSTAAIHDGLLYIADYPGYFYCIDAATGKILWEHDFQESTWCSPYYVDGKVYIGTDNGALYIFKADRKANTPKKILIGPPIKVPPIAANGVLYVNAGTALYAIAP